MSRNAKSLYLAAQSAWGSDPSADGSGYLPVPAEGISEVPMGVEQIEVQYSDGRVFSKASEVGAPSLGELSFQMPLWGLGTAAGDGASPPSVDVLDTLLTHVLQTAAVLDGEGVGSGSTATDLVLDADAFDVGHLLPYCPGSGSETQWAYVTADDTDGTYTVAPAMSPAAVDAGAVYGSRYWTPPATGLTGGEVLSFVLVDDDVGTYRYANCRVTSMSLEATVGQRIMLSVTVQADSVTEDSTAKTSLPTAVAAPPVTPVKALASPVAFDGTFYDCAGFSFDFGITAAPINATSSSTGRAGHEIITLAPVLTFKPLRTDAIRELARAASTGAALVQLGGGVLAGTVLNTLALYLGQAQMTAAAGEDDSGHARQGVTLTGRDPGSSGVFLRVARA